MSYKLVAHRGYATKFPENTLAAVQAALDLGVAMVEIDLQWTKDSVPVLLHDIDLARTAGQPDSIFDLTVVQATSMLVNETARFGHQYQTSLPTFSDLVLLMKSYPHAGCLVELKTESLDHFGMESCVDQIIQLVGDRPEQFPLISYSLAALAYAKKKHGQPVGWVLTHYDAESLAQAERLQPDYLICNHRKLPRDLAALPALNSHWVFYEVEDSDTAQWLHQLGCEYLETMNPAAFSFR